MELKFPSKDILIITVNFHNSEKTSELLNSMPKYKEIELWIEDNESSKSSFKSLKSLKSDFEFNISIFPHIENNYYWGAFNKALSRLPKDFESWPEWIIICNNDIQIDSNFFKKLSKLDFQKFHVIAPSIISIEKNKDLNPFFEKPFTRIEKLYYGLVYLNKYFSLVIQFLGSKVNKIRNSFSFITKVEKVIYAPHGACMIFSKNFFIKGGYIDTSFKMFGEEISTAEIAKKIGASIIYKPELIVKHFDHNSTKNISWDLLYKISKETYFYLKKTYKL